MSEFETFSQDEEWKEKLRRKLIAFVAGSQQEKEATYADVGICYQCYAPASLYKYYSDNPRNLNSVILNKMWYELG